MWELVKAIVVVCVSLALLLGLLGLLYWLTGFLPKRWQESWRAWVFLLPAVIALIATTLASGAEIFASVASMTTRPPAIEIRLPLTELTTPVTALPDIGIVPNMSPGPPGTPGCGPAARMRWPKMIVGTRRRRAKRRTERRMVV